MCSQLFSFLLLGVNMDKTLKMLGLGVLMSWATLVTADDASIKSGLSNFIPVDTIESIKPTAVNGLYEVIAGQQVVYVTEDGKYLLSGSLIESATKKNLTSEAMKVVEAKQAVTRKAVMDKVDEKTMIVFKPKTGKHMISVFTDIDCGYCRKLHSEIDQYLAQGITVRYMFFPRAGKGSDAYKKAVSVWCAPDRQKALTAAKKGDKVDSKSCDNPIDQHMALAESFEVSGTPMIVTEKGNVLPGYVPADKLAAMLADE